MLLVWVGETNGCGDAAQAKNAMTMFVPPTVRHLIPRRTKNISGYIGSLPAANMRRRPLTQRCSFVIGVVTAMQSTQKIEKCLRIANEYRGVAELRNFTETRLEDAEAKLTWRSAFPQRWATSVGGRIGQIILTPIMAPFTLVFVYVVAPLVNLYRSLLGAKQALSHGNVMIESSIRELASRCNHDNLYTLWLEFGLAERTSRVSFSSRVECLERWVDVLYGGGMASVMQVRNGVEGLLRKQESTQASFGAAGGHSSHVDPVDHFARDLSSRLAKFR